MSVTYAKLADRLVDAIERGDVNKVLPAMNPDQAFVLLKLTTNLIIDALAEGEDVALDGFGRFYPDIRPPKKVHSGITRQDYMLGYRVIIRFNAFNKMASKVRKLIAWITPEDKEIS